jgi:hypothetical protein
MQGRGAYYSQVTRLYVSMDKALSVKSMDALQDLLEGRQSNGLRREIFGKRSTGERGINDGKPFWSSSELMAFILLICWCCKPRILALVLDIPKWRSCGCEKGK